MERTTSSIQHSTANVLLIFRKELRDVQKSMASQSAYLARHLAVWGNRRIAHLDALVFAALRSPCLSGAEALPERGLRGMQNALACHFLPDGAHVELTLARRSRRR
jgi:uncharacterized heparinase superfamily protein